jgi:DNA primase
VENTFVDFRLVKQHVSMSAVLDRYHVQLRKVGQNSLRGKCPLPTHSSKKSGASFGVDLAKNIWACQSDSCYAARQGKRGGNVLDFVTIMENCSVRDAALKLQRWFSITPPTATSSTPLPNQRRGAEHEQQLAAKRNEGSDEELNKPLKFALKGIDPNHPYIKKRGITPETAQEFGIGFFPGRGVMAGRVVIPIHNECGELLAYAGRAIDDESDGKYKLPPGFRKSAVLFNLQRVPADSDEVVVVEGFFGCMKVWQAGFKNVVALMGSSLSERQQKVLSRFSHIILLLDGDEAGRGAAAEIAGRFVHSHFVRVVDLEDGVQPDKLSSEELRARLNF